MNILHTFKICAALATVALVAASCTEEQSSLNIGDIEGKAKIVGNISYSKGKSYQKGQYIENKVPATQKTVYFYIDNNTLDPKSSSQGVTTYKATTDYKGNYEIEVPALPKGTTVYIQPETFFGDYTDILKFENGNPVFKTNEGYFSIKKQQATVSPDQIIVEDLVYNFTKRDISDYQSK